MDQEEKNTKKEKRQESIHKTVKNLDKYFYAFESTVSGIALGLIAVVVFYGVLLRFVFHHANPYGEELARYLFLVCVFIGLSAGVGKGSHLGVTSFVNMMPKKVGYVVTIIQKLITIATYGIMTFLSIKFTQTALSLQQHSVALGVPMAAMYALLIISFGLCTIRSIMLFWSDYFDPQHTLSEKKEEVML